MEYLHWKEEKISSNSPEIVDEMYDKGFVFIRLDTGVMHQTRSIRINLKTFELSSENRRILRKGESISLITHHIPYAQYDWKIGKMAKDFYDKKAGGAFSANKIREIITTEHNFTNLLDFNSQGYAICYSSPSILHYSYPFYNLETAPKDMGLIMMTKTLVYAQEHGLKYVYLGSLQRKSDVYKLQFSGIEWFDGEKWNIDIEEVKKILTT